MKAALPQVMGLDGAGVVLGSTLGDLHEMTQLLQAVQRGGIRPVIDSTWALDEVHGTLSRLEAGTQFGKLAITLPV